MQALRYVGLALVLGALSVWASENFFWMMPPPGITPLDFTFTVVAYSIACAVALSAVIWTGIGGMPAAFLGGAFWAQYWPSERDGVPVTWLFAIYILGVGLLVPLAHVGMDRLGQMPRPRAWVLWVAPVMALLVWGAQGASDLNPYRLMLLVILALVLWTMWRLGKRDLPVSLGPAVPVWQHGLFLIAPLIVVVLAPLGWAQGWGTLESNWVIAGISCVLAVGWLGWLVWRAVRAPQ